MAVEEPIEYTEDIDFQKYWLILKRHWLPSSIVFLSIFSLATVFASTRTPVYQASGKLLLKKQNPASALVSDAAAKIGRLEAIDSLNSSAIDTEVEVLTSTPIIEQAIQELDIRNTEGNLVPAGAVLQLLNVKVVGGTDVLEISYSSENQEETAEVVNKIMDIYMANNIAFNKSAAVSAREFIAEELPKIEENLLEAETALRRFKEDNSIVDLEMEAREAVKVMSQLDTLRKRTEAALADATARLAAFQNKVGMNSSQALIVTKLSQSPTVQQALTDLLSVQQQLSIQQTRYNQKHPIITNLKRQENALNLRLQQEIARAIGSQAQLPEGSLRIGQLEQKLVEELINIEAQRNGLVEQVESIWQAQESYQNRARILPELQARLQYLYRQLNAAQSTYNILLQNLQEVQILENQNVGNARVISYAGVPEHPVGPGKKLFLAVGIVGGGMLYVIVAFLLELVDPSLKTIKEIRELFRYTTIGIIPYIRPPGLPFLRRRKEDLIPILPVKNNPQSLVSESYRMLQANLKFLSPDRPLKVIAVTSSVSKEGKSTVSANLAMTMAQLGYRILLIDADLRHPMQHHVWGLTNAAGLSEVIVRQTEADRTVIEVMDNLEVLPSGVIPPNPLALIESQRMDSLIKEFEWKYDLIIIDTPPLVIMADAVILGKMVDGILLVARAGVVDTVSGIAAKDLLARTRVNVLGVVINGVIVENEPDSYFHHAREYYQQATKSSQLVASRGENKG